MYVLRNVIRIMLTYIGVKVMYRKRCSATLMTLFFFMFHRDIRNIHLYLEARAPLADNGNGKLGVSWYNFILL